MVDIGVSKIVDGANAPMAGLGGLFNDLKISISSTENLSKKSTTILSQSSTYALRNASYANDGNLNTKEFSCAHTATCSNQSKAWFQVDLGRPHRIQHVKIYYRREGNEPDDWKQYRFRKFYLDVSDYSATESMTSQRTRCYTDNTTEPNLPPNIIDIPCKQLARYIIVESTYKAPEDYRSTGPILEICEIEVYGCNARHYGSNCSKKCSVNCVQEICNIINGSCIFGCKSGYYGHMCNESCSLSCPSACDRYTGYCDGICPVDYFGHFCKKLCNSNCAGGCNRETGLCEYGCIEGKFGEACEETCSIGCNSSCEQDNGNCSCKGDWKGDKCDENESIVFNREEGIHDSVSQIYLNQLLPNISTQGNEETTIQKNTYVENNEIYVNDTFETSKSQMDTRIYAEGSYNNTHFVEDEDVYMAIHGLDPDESIYEHLQVM
ncbi:uncharacterized protein LOC133178662 [Saccostrea echinata]|uniref:uncharacterized protein LOC133178662 n=1 Tax=Saccostrea echinata TaxID=191078 RepID=UPI002A81AFAA|nr:uncharacterized protein LOC133178662 [Saccostrea echinata]